MAYYSSNENYTVNLSESINEVNSSDFILLFNSTTLYRYASDLMVNLTNLNKIYGRLKNKKDVAEIKFEIENNKRVFKYIRTMAGGSGFSYIIPVKEDKPLGIIIFKSTQGRSKDIDIIFNFTISDSSLGFSNGIELSSKVNSAQFNSTTLIGTENWQYSSYLNENGGESKYSRFVRNSADDVPAVITNLGVFDGKIETKLTLNQNFSINPHRVDNLEDNLRFSYYAGDLAVYAWTGKNYTIYSLTKNNKFGLPVSYTPSDTGYKIFTAEINSWSGGVPNGTALIDEWDPEGKTIINRNYEKVFGDWKNNGTYWKNWYGSVYLENKVIPVNNRVLLEKTDSGYKMYYDGKKIDEFSESDRLEDTYLTRFRRSYIQIENVPEIIGAVSGIIYYRGNNGNIWYL